MVFSSLIFISLFFPATLVGYYICKFNRNIQNVFLLLVSLFFYAWGEPKFSLVLMLSIFVNWIFGLLVDRFRHSKLMSRSIIVAMLVYNLSIIFVYKYLMFTLENIQNITNATIDIPNIALPIGISFFTFQAISYVIDVYRCKGEAQKNPLNVGLYISFFPQLIAGPIIRYETVAEQIKNRRETLGDFCDGCKRFMVGFLKKILLANNFALIADVAFNSDVHISTAMAWLGIVCYTLQIYYDFSGYSDMAIGLGKMFGFHFPENFNYPYVSKSTTEFWRRWHISLGTWFRDYVFIPLGGSRSKSSLRNIFNLFVVWFLTGLWHGANWTFILWGLLFFVSISIEKMTGFDKSESYPILKNLYTLFLVMMGWVLFRSTDLESAFGYFKSLFTVSDTGFIDGQFLLYFSDNLVFLVCGLLFARPIAVSLSKRKISNSMFIQFGYSVILTGLFLVAISYLVKGAYNPFIYFNF